MGALKIQYSSGRIDWPSRLATLSRGFAAWLLQHAFNRGPRFFLLVFLPSLSNSGNCTKHRLPATAVSPSRFAYKYKRSNPSYIEPFVPSV